LYSAQRQAGAAVGVAVLATILVSRRNALVGPLIGDAALPKIVEAFHQAMLGAVALSLIGFVAAAFIHDSDAAPTMVRRDRPDKATRRTASARSARGAPVDGAADGAPEAPPPEAASEPAATSMEPEPGR
jgi:hypothetical protein